jgi:O-succinylhomoserine sulfhydrylase
VLGGAVLGKHDFIMGKVFPFVRTAGPTLSAFNAWVMLKGMETLAIRMERHSASALALAQFLESHPAVARVYHPALKSHPQHEIAMRQQSGGGAIVSFELKGATPEQQRANAWRVIDSTRLCSITGNLGDTRTTITPPYTTTHARVSPEAKAAAGFDAGKAASAVGDGFKSMGTQVRLRVLRCARFPRCLPPKSSRARPPRRRHRASAAAPRRPWAACNGCGQMRRRS